ncbi:hypothetical protein KMT30_42630, partial [Streptomyces sp. IBSBF 2953]|nr:hypothetical protein [Streptomyces hayashii]
MDAPGRPLYGRHRRPGPPRTAAAVPGPPRRLALTAVPEPPRRLGRTAGPGTAPGRPAELPLRAGRGPGRELRTDPEVEPWGRGDAAGQE